MMKAAAYQYSQGGGGDLSPLSFIRQDLVKEFSHTRMLGPAQEVDGPGVMPFSLRATLKSSRISARTYCYTPVDTTWLWWFLGLPFTSYTFDLKLDLELLGPDGAQPLWSHSIDKEVKGTTNFYYATGPTGENNLEQIYDDLLAEAMSTASAELQTALSEKKADFWSKISAGAPAAARGSRKRHPAAESEEETESAPAAAAPGAQTPWWQQDADKGEAKTERAQPVPRPARAEAAPEPSPAEPASEPEPARTPPAPRAKPAVSDSDLTP
jgi:hypothetical protein